MTPEEKRAYRRRRYQIIREEYREKQRRWYSENPNRVREYYRKKYAKSKAKKLEYSKRYYEKNKAKKLELNRRWRAANPDKYREYHKRNQSENINYRLSRMVRTRIYYVLKGINKRPSSLKLIGCSWENLKIYIESKFEVGMSWENYGKKWEVDHIMPCAIFDLSKPEHQKKCFHFSNLQPMWSPDNRSKGAKTDWKKPAKL